MVEQTPQKAPLDELMAAMDVVDTLRHQQNLALRELNDDARRERMLEQLRKIYAEQGISVPDSVLQEGIKALEEERFKYVPVANSFAKKIARIWVRRKRYKVPAFMVTFFAAVVSGDWLFNDVLPERDLRANLPIQLERTLAEINSISKDPAVIESATVTFNSANSAFNNDKLEVSEELQDDLEQTLSTLREQYSIRVVSRPNELSGFYRIPEVNPNARNYYLIVEAVSADGTPLLRSIENEESGKRESVKKWGLRVSERTFLAIADDKRDDGIIQLAKVGAKRVGYLEPTYSIQTTGATVTQW